MEKEHFGLEYDYCKLSLLITDEYLLSTVDCHRGLVDLKPTDISTMYLYTGRGPSRNSLHIGHLLGLNLTLALHKRICHHPIYFMIADDEKMMRDSIDFETISKNTCSTIEQLNRIGFKSDNTNFRINTLGLSSEEYKMIIQMMSLVSLNELNHIFGEKSNVGEYFYVFYQLLPCFLEKTLQCVIVAGVDQDPFFRLARKIAYKMHYKPPMVIYTKNVPSLDGNVKMSSSSVIDPIYVSDTDDEIRKKVFAIKQVGAGTLDELFAFGCNLNNDVPFQIIKLFEKDTSIVSKIAVLYTCGVNTDTFVNTIPFVGEITKAFISRNNITKITTYGVRLYTYYVLKNLISSYEQLA